MRTFKLSRNRERYPSLLGSYSSLLLILVFGIGIFFVYLQINQGSFILAKKNKVEIQVIGRDIRNEALWPGVPVEQLGHSLVTKGVNFLPTIRSMFENKNLDKLHEFLSLYENRPDKVNLCGIRINHALALFATIKHLKPSAIIESGVNAGVSTYIMRGAAGPNVKIFSIDPLENPICGQSSRWIDKNSNTEYFTGTKFKDFSEIDWNIIMKDNVIDPKNVLVYFDDHLNIFDRFPALMKNSFRHVLLEDNYKVGEGATPGDKAGFTPKQMFARIDEDSKFAFNQMITYFEFPPLIPPGMAKLYPGSKKKQGGFLHAEDNANLECIMEPLLHPDHNTKKGISDNKIYHKICDLLSIDPELKDDASYMQIMNYCFIAYFELQPLAPRLVKTWK